MIRRHVITLVLTVVIVGGIFGANIAAGNNPNLGLDLQGGASVTLSPEGDFSPEALDVAVDIIRQRVDSLGVAEPEIIRQGNTVVVNLPGVKDQQRALDLVGQTGSVEMRPVINVVQDPELSPSTTAAGATTTVPAGSTDTTAPPAQKDDTTDTTLAEPTGGVGSSRGRPAAESDRITTASTTPAPTGTATTVPASQEGSADDQTDPDTGLKPGQTVLRGRGDGLLYLLGPAEATGEVFSNDASAQIDRGAWVVVAQLNDGPAGEDLWNALSTKCFEGGEECPTKQIAIILDGEVISAPVVQTPTFTGGSVQISGDFSESEATDLAKILQFGAVPVDFDAPTVQTVSATLGKDSLNAAIISGLIGVALVILFAFAYYRIFAIILVGGLAVSGMMLWSVVAWLSRTNGLAFTISGAAGIIVSIGTNVDSYIMLFERLKEDVQAGRTIKNSTARGFENAWRTIVVANTSTLIGAVILWWLTVGAVRGFAFFLGVSSLTGMLATYFFARPAALLLSRAARLNRGKAMGVRAESSELSPVGAHTHVGAAAEGASR